MGTVLNSDQPVGVIDCGTNSFNLLIVHPSVGPTKPLVKQRRTVKLFEDAAPGAIGQKGFERGIAALKDYASLLHQHQVTYFRAIGTEGLRSALNGKQFLEAAQQAAGIRIQLISGLEEADLIYRGVRQAVPLSSTPVLIMDIGGGSTEFILCSINKVYYSHSFQLGAAKLINQFAPADPMTQSQRLTIQSDLKKALAPLFVATNKNPPQHLIGSSGSFSSLANILHHQDHGVDLPPTTLAYPFDLDRVPPLLHHLSTATFASRLAIPGLVPTRADMIHMSAVLLSVLLEAIPFTALFGSAFALKEGMYAKMVERTV